MNRSSGMMLAAAALAMGGVGIGGGGGGLPPIGRDRRSVSAEPVAPKTRAQRRAELEARLARRPPSRRRAGTMGGAPKSARRKRR